MKVVDLHPEDLIDKDGRGVLTETERERLDAHLARCSACRFERDARAEFALALESDEELSVRRLLAIVGEISLTAPPARTSETTTRVPSVRPLATRRMTRTALLIAAAALLIGGAATATATGGVRIWTHLAAVFVDDAPTTRTPSKVTPTSTPAVFASATAIATAATDTTDTTDTHAATVAPSQPTTPATSLARRAPEETGESAGRLFENANEARRQGDYARAVTLHRRLQATYPSSPEAHASHATVGRLLLDRGNASGALASFDAYQRRGAGPLDEAVLVGRAIALERVGSADEARAAWATLLARFPETPYAEHAKARSEGLHAR